MNVTESIAIPAAPSIPLPDPTEASSNLSKEFADQDRPLPAKPRRGTGPVPAGGRNKLIDRARKAFTRGVDSSDIEKIARRMVGIALDDPDGRLALEAAKFIFNYRIGRPKQEIDINETSTLTFEERKTLVLEMLSVDEDDATLRFSKTESTGRTLPNPGDSPAPNTKALLSGPEPLPDMGEVPPSGSDVGIRVKVRRKADDADEAAGPSV
jgi:hypothetical protein